MEYQKILLGERPYAIYMPKSSFNTHFHDELEILYCKKGRLSVIANNVEYRLYDNCAIFINTLEEHELIIDNNETEVLCIEFGFSLLGSEFHQKISTSKFLYPFLDLSTSNILPPNILMRVKAILDMINLEHTSDLYGSSLMIRSGMIELAAIIARHFPIDVTSTLRRKKRINNMLKIQHVFELVEKNYAKKITLEDAAASLAYDPKSFCRLFKNITNMSFHRYLNIYRIDIALKLLEDKKHTINDVACYCGIPVPKTFSRVFREITGMSPTEYRNLF